MPRGEFNNSVVISAEAQRSISEFGGETGVGFGELCPLEAHGEQQVRVSVLLANGHNHVERNAPSWLDLGLTHCATVPLPAGLPRHQSVAAMAFLPAGCTTTS
jgi:hypothetical protein